MQKAATAWGEELLLDPAQLCASARPCIDIFLSLLSLLTPDILPDLLAAAETFDALKSKA